MEYQQGIVSQAVFLSKIKKYFYKQGDLFIFSSINY